MMDIIRRLILGLALAGFSPSCGPIPGPQPPQPTPPPGPQCHGQPFPEPQCVEGQAHSCWHCPPDSTAPLYACPVYDAAGNVIGIVNVTGGPAQCPSAPGPTPPLPTPTPTPTPGPTPPPSAEFDCDGLPGDLTGTLTRVHGDAVNVAMRDITGCSIGSRCVLGPDNWSQAFYRKVTDRLRAGVTLQDGRFVRLCAGQHEPNVMDELAVASDARAVREGYHVFAGYGGQGPLPPGEVERTVVWSPGAARPSYFAPGSAPGPTPTPPPSTQGCTDPITPKVDRFGAPHLINGWYDATPQFYSGETRRWDGTVVTGYCDAIGFVNRLHCPARMECGETPNPRAVKCEERLACERLGVGGDAQTGKPLWRSDGQVELHPDNIFKARTSGTWIQVCASDGTACSEKVQ